MCITVFHLNDKYMKLKGPYYKICLLLNREGHGKISVFAVKMALATLCGGKIMDKLRCKYLG